MRVCSNGPNRSQPIIRVLQVRPGPNTVARMETQRSTLVQSIKVVLLARFRGALGIEAGDRLIVERRIVATRG
jgi:hypothetical protein